MVILGIPLLVVVAVVLAIIVYTQTKSWKKTGYSLEIVISLAVFVLSSKFSWDNIADSSAGTAIILLGAGMLINGIVSLLKK